jgi:D-aspartate ligase
VNRPDLPPACVIGDMDLIRPLGLAGVPVVVVTSRPDAAARFTRYRRAVVDWPHPADDPDGAVAALVRFGSQQPAKPVLFCQGDADLLLVSRARAALAPHFLLTLPGSEMVEDLVDKQRFTALADRLGLPVPRTRVLRRGDPLAAAARDVPFPAVLKPVTRRKWVGFSPESGQAEVPKAVRLERPEDLQALAATLERLDTDFVLQEFVPGGEDAIVSYHAYVNAAGDVAAEFTGEKIRTLPRECGFTTALRITSDAEVASLGREVIGRIGYRGIVKVDFKRSTAGGDLRLLELNPRFNLWHHPGALAGVNLPYLAYCEAAGLPAPAMSAARPGVRWCWFWKDFAAYREQRRVAGGSYLSWLRFALAAEAQSVFAWDDPAPFVRGVLLRAAGRALRRLGRRGSTAARAANPAASARSLNAEP